MFNIEIVTKKTCSVACDSCQAICRVIQNPSSSDAREDYEFKPVEEEAYEFPSN